FDDNGQKLGYLGLHLDISELKRQAAELLAAKDAAELANLAKSQFLAMMSHEIRTPMNGVIGMTSLLLDSPLNSAQRDYVETIRHSGDALLTIINDILDFSKIESGRLELEDAEFSLHECVEGALDLLSPRANEKGLVLLFEIADGVPRHVRGDATRLRQILVNLLANAVKFTVEGEVVLTVRLGHKRGEAQELAFTITDTGIGIPAEAISRLFQSFTQVDASTTRRFGGTGLGLAISKRLAELMGGRLWVESTPGKGSSFSFTAWLKPEPSRPLRYVGSAGTPVLEGRRLLIVDDNATSRRILKSITSRWGLNVTMAASADEALTRLGEDVAFDCALLDMRMDGMTGAELAREFRQRPGGRHLPLILLSSMGLREGVMEPERFATCLTKPVKPDQLFDAIGRVLTPLAEEPIAPRQVDLTSDAVQPDRLLLAEDNAVNQRVALHMLARLGYRADIAANGKEVLTALQRQPYDLILMDVQMPEMDGLEATRELRAWTDLRVRPWIIAVTANAMQGDRQICLDAGMDDYVSKPLKVEELAAALERARAARV
ncbi:MAG TPA: response regulator, partial [Candidatus Synoicihabitans sp.]|nr:response regulator [Candidatus Synoicihabitans sp.]